MIIGVPKESYPGERRVALVPASVAPLAKIGHEVRVEAGAGAEAGYPDKAYSDLGARIVEDRAELFAAAELIVQVRGHGTNAEAGAADLERMREGQAVIGFLDPLAEAERARELAARGVTAFSMELIPRITRAQSMDALSSMATVAGYKAVLLGAGALPRMFPMLMTAAGTITPAKVLIVGVGVAGLQAISTARRLGAVVSAYDVRPAVKEQVQSVGAKFVDLGLDTAGAETKGGYAKEQSEDFLRRQREAMKKVVAEHDVVITTAAVPGRRAPVIVTEEMVAAMAPGSVIVDIAAERGGNCALTKPGETVVAHGVTILGPNNLPATVPYHASQMYAKNVQTLIAHMTTKEKVWAPNEADEIVRETMVSKGGEVVHAQVRKILGLEPLPVAEPVEGEAASSSKGAR